MLELPEAQQMVKEILLAAPGTYFRPMLGSCIYFGDRAEPCCVIGHVFSKIGIGLADLVEAEPQEGNDLNMTRFEALRPTWEGKISEEAALFLQRAQDKQDLGITWGEVCAELFGREDA